jgi:hypothetical protein
MSGGIFLPEMAAEHAERRRAIDQALQDTSRKRCPAAEIGTYADSGNHYCRCGVESVPGRPAHFPLEANPLVALGFCLGEFDHPENGCPTWIARNDDQAKIERVQRARDRANSDQATREQIRSGMRVDDAGVEYEEEQEAREVVFNAMSSENAERTARLQRALVENEHERKRLGVDPERDAAIARAKVISRSPVAGDKAVRYRLWSCTLKGCAGSSDPESDLVEREEIEGPLFCQFDADGVHELKPMRGVYSRAQATAHFGPVAVSTADQAYAEDKSKGRA